MNSFENGSNGMQLAVQIMALQTLHRAWQNSSARAAGGDMGETGGRRRLLKVLLFLACALPPALLILHAVAF